MKFGKRNFELNRASFASLSFCLPDGPKTGSVLLSRPFPCSLVQSRSLHKHGRISLGHAKSIHLFKKKSKINFRQERKGNTDISIINPVPRAVVYGHEQRAASVAACLATCPWGWPFLSASQHAEEVLSLGWTVAHGRAEEVLLLHGAGRSTVHVGLVQLRCGCTR